VEAEADADEVELLELGGRELEEEEDAGGVDACSVGLETPPLLLPPMVTDGEFWLFPLSSFFSSDSDSPPPPVAEIPEPEELFPRVRLSLVLTFGVRAFSLMTSLLVLLPR